MKKILINIFQSIFIMIFFSNLEADNNLKGNADTFEHQKYITENILGLPDNEEDTILFSQNLVWKPFTGAGFSSYENGQLKDVCGYKEGLLDGKCEHFYDDGTPRYKFFYINGLMDGWQEIFFKTGQLKARLYYEKGDKLEAITYLKDGGIRTKEKFDKNKK